MPPNNIVSVAELKGEDNQVTCSTNPQVFLTFAVNGEFLGRVEIELFADVVPRTAENFRSLCTGERGVGESGKSLHLKGTNITRVVAGFMCQGGDVVRNNGTGGESIYGQYFKDENYKVKYSSSGVLGMLSWGKDRNQSQFFITMKPADWIEEQYVAFGHVIKGMDVVRQIEKLGDEFGRISKKIVISDCGDSFTSIGA